MTIKNGYGNSGDQVVKFTSRDATRIGSAVRAHEQNRRPRNPSAIPRASGGGGGGESEPSGIYTATFAGAWLKNTYKTAYLTPVAAGTATASVMNLLHDIVGNGTGAPRLAIVASIGGREILVNYGC